MLRSLVFFLLLIFSFLFFDVQIASAHRPHDVISQVEISPTYGHDQTLFIIVRGNLFKSINGGSSWKRIVQGLDNRSNLSSLAISPQTNQILYLSSTGDGIYKSVDGGFSWYKVNNGLESRDIDLISVATDSFDIALAAGHANGLYKTKDGGESWYQVINSNHKITAIEFFRGEKQVVAGDLSGI